MTPAIGKPLPAQLSPQRMRDQQRSMRPEPVLTKLLDRSGMELRKQPRASGDMSLREIKPPTADRLADTRRVKDHPGTAIGEPQHMDRRQLRRPLPHDHSARRQMQLDFEEHQKRGEIETKISVGNRSQRPSPSASQRQFLDNPRPVQGRGIPAGQHSTITANSPRPLTADTPRSAATGSHVDSARSSLSSPRKYETPNHVQRNLNVVSLPYQVRPANEISQPQKRKPRETSVVPLKKADISLNLRVSPAEAISSTHNVLPRKMEASTPTMKRQTRLTTGTAENFGKEAVSQSGCPYEELVPHSVGKRDAMVKMNSRIPTLLSNRNTERALPAPRNLSVDAERKTKQLSEEVDDSIQQNSNKKLPEKKGVMYLDRLHGAGIKSNKTEELKLSPQRVEKNISTQQQSTPVATDVSKTRNQMVKGPLFEKRDVASPPPRNMQTVAQETRGPDKGHTLDRNIPLAVTVARYPPSSVMKPGTTKNTSETSPMKYLRKATNLTVRNEKSEQQTKLQITSPVKTVLVSTATSPVNSPRFSQITSRTNSSRTETVTEHATASPVASNMTVPNAPSTNFAKMKKSTVPSKQSPTSLLGIPVDSTKMPSTAFSVTPHENLPTDSSTLPTESTQKQQRYGKLIPSKQTEASRNPKGRAKIISYKTRPREPAFTNSQLGEKLPTTAKTHHQHQKEVGYQHYINELPDLPEINENNPHTLSARSPPLEQIARDSQGKNSKKTPENFPEHPLRMRISSFEASRKQAATTKVRKGGTITQADANRGKQKRSGRARTKTQATDVAAALPDVTGNFTSAVHQWLSRSHYAVVRPQHAERPQQETIEEEKESELKIKTEDHVLETAEHVGVTEENADRQRKTERQRTDTVRRQQKESNTPSKRAQNTRSSVKGSKAATGHETAKVKPVSRKHSRTRPTRRKKESLRAGSEALSGAQPHAKRLPKGSSKAHRHKTKSRRGPAGDSGDFLSNSSSTASYLSASDDMINEQSAV